MARHTPTQTQDPSVEDDISTQGENASNDETESPSEADLDAVDKMEADLAEKAATATEDTKKKLARLGVAYPSTTPGEQTVGGYGGINITVGDLRRLAIAFKKDGIEI